MKINYIVTVYLGPRRSKVMKLVRQLNILYHIERHLEAIKTLNIPEISRITFVINDYSQESTDLAIEYIRKFDLPIEKVITTRPNSGFSYGAWQQALQESLDDGFDYAFLIEDDYVPIRPDFLDAFIARIKENNVAFVCQLWKGNHAAISNGLISYAAINDMLDIRKKCGLKNLGIFDLYTGDSYEDAIYNQLHYLSYFIGSGFKCVDTSECSAIPFLESDWDKLRTYGDIKCPTYIDINIPKIGLKYRPANFEDCETINRIRNSYAHEYLHDSRTFTLEETQAWFKQNEILQKFHYIMIICNNVVIGYFRISRYSSMNNSCYIGADIDSRFTGFGLGYTAYIGFLPMLSGLDIFERKLHKVSLEVLSTNERAIKLYKKLGFEETGILYDEVLKDGKYVNSILMVKFL